MAASGCSNTPLYRRAIAPRPGLRRSIPRRLPRRVAAAVSGGRPKTVPIWRMAGARPLARIRRRFAHRGRGPTGLRLAGRRRRLETPHAVLRSSGCPDVGIHPEVGAGEPLGAPLLQVIEAPFRSVIHGLARRACPDVGMLRPLGRRRLDTPHLALPASTPSAHRASRCRSSDWDPSAFETRASPIRMYRKRSFATGGRGPTRLLTAVSKRFRVASRSRALRFKGFVQVIRK